MSEQVQVENDSWRVAVSDILRFRAQITKEVVSVGVLNKAVMWSRERWEEAQQKRESPEVRKAQAGMLRASASQVKKGIAPQHIEDVVEEVAAKEAAHATGTTGAAAASAGNGRRSAGVLTLSQLGR